MYKWVEPATFPDEYVARLNKTGLVFPFTDLKDLFMDFSLLCQNMYLDAIAFTSLVLCRYQDKEGMVPAAYLRRYDGQGVGLASTGVEIVSTLKDATVANDKKSLVKSTPAKPAQSSLSSSMTVNPQKTLSNPSGLRSPTFSSPSVALNSSLTSSGPTTTSPTQLSPTPKSPLGGTPEGSQSADRTTPSPSPKPVNVMALAAAVAAEKQTFAPSWHSRAKPHVDEEREF